MNPKLWGQVAHVVDGKEAHDRPTYWQPVKFAVKKEPEINFDEAKKAPKPGDIKWPSGWSMPPKHSQVNALGVIRWDISSAITTHFGIEIKTHYHLIPE